MRKFPTNRYFIIIFLLGFFPTQNIAEPNTEIFSVTITELMARPTQFDGIKVRVKGVANLDFLFEAQPSLYSSKEDWLHWTDNQIDLVGPFEGEASKASQNQMEKMNGEYIILEGIFRYSSREKLRIEGGGFASCWQRCRHYWVEKITRLDKWEMKRKSH